MGVPVAVDPHVARAGTERVGAARRQGGRYEHEIEEPLEIRADGSPLAVTMRTPGEDEELAAGFLAGEGLLAVRDDLASVGPTPDLAVNTIEIRTVSGLRRDPGQRNFYTSSSCGVCGKGALDSGRGEAADPPPATTTDAAFVTAAPERARSRQTAFERTGGLHAT